MTAQTPSSGNKLIPEGCYQIIRELVYAKSRINLGDNKRELVQSRLAKRLRALDFQSYEDYCEFVTSSRGTDELEHLINSMSTNHTFFFREPQHFDFLEQVALPQLCAQKTAHPIHLWSAASSSGEEAYTLAIVLSEFFRRHASHIANPWRIECTDISSRILETARLGIYPEERLKKIEWETLRRYFQKGCNQWSGHFRVKSSLRERVHFQLQNLLAPPYPFKEPFDIIFCRNVMIYFDKPTQTELVNHLYKHLKPGGYLMIGHSESLTGIQHKYHTIRPAIYQKS